ncbi:hypothetical protein DID88_008457 [Monilinia fructigena]|uniref:Uncharacterized protein n=1 Tax=Monilinia fructigena TaxID=38457 RepID=A0A395J5E9_9HELO|nr:hypothetical protein DID88_008457 [Monilinia fructigena]
MNFPSTKLCYHWDTLPPTEAQLVHANGFFTKEPQSSYGLHQDSAPCPSEIALSGYWICRDMGMVEDRNGERKLSKYLEKRKQLKRAFVLIDAEHGIKENDRNESSVEPDPESGDADFTTGEILTCTSEKRAGRKYGVDAVRFAMLRAAGLHIQPKVKLAKPVEMISYEELFERQNTTR